MEIVIFIFIGTIVIYSGIWNYFDKRKKEKLEKPNDRLRKLGIKVYSEEECISELDKQKEYELDINNFEYLKTRSNYEHIFLDYTNKEISIISDGCKELDIYKFENIIGCEREIKSKNEGNSSTKTDGGIGRAILGGIVAGGVGAIVGATTASKTTETINYSEISEITLKIILNNNKNELIELKFPYKYLDGENLLDNGTILYTKILNIIDSNKKEIIIDNNKDNIKEKLIQLKELLAENIITQEEFEYKKKELLSKI